MKSPIEQVDELDNIIGQLQKIEGRLYAGQFIQVYIDVGSLLAYFKEAKKQIIKEDKLNQDKKEIS